MHALQPEEKLAVCYAPMRTSGGGQLGIAGTGSAGEGAWAPASQARSAASRDTAWSLSNRMLSLHWFIDAAACTA